MTSDHHKKEIDHISGVETTGHEWDGLKELNNPAPRWWLWVFFICVFWSIGYWIVYPAWPTLSGEGERGGTVGSFGWTQYKKLQEEQAEIIARKGEHLAQFKGADFAAIKGNEELYNFAIAGGKAAFKENCASSHGCGGAGAPGYPNLNDDDWLWGGTLEDIYQTIRYGIRSGHEETRDSAMPAFAGVIEDADIEKIADFVLSLQAGVNGTHPGYALFQENCASCHGENGKGVRDFGAPNLSDAIWLKSNGSKAAIVKQIKNPQHGVMPAWVERLNDDTIRQLAVYVHSLGGGE